MSDEEIIKEVCCFPSDFIVFTGGEPSLFLDDELISSLHQRNKYLAVETNGTHKLPAQIDWVTLSPKTNIDAHADVVLEKCNEMKVIYTGDDVEKFLKFKAEHYFLQPCDTGNAIRNAQLIKETIDYCLQHPKWRLSLQTHKILGLK